MGKLTLVFLLCLHCCKTSANKSVVKSMDIANKSEKKVESMDIANKSEEMAECMDIASKSDKEVESMDIASKSESIASANKAEAESMDIAIKSESEDTANKSDSKSMDIANKPDNKAEPMETANKSESIYSANKAEAESMDIAIKSESGDTARKSGSKSVDIAYESGNKAESTDIANQAVAESKGSWGGTFAKWALSRATDLAKVAAAQAQEATEFAQRAQQATEFAAQAGKKAQEAAQQATEFAKVAAAHAHKKAQEATWAASGQWPIHQASRTGELESIKAILAPLTSLEKLEEVNRQTRRGVMTAGECVTSLFAKCIFGESPFHLAAKSGNLNLMAFLSGQGANTSQVNSVGWNALFYVAQDRIMGEEKRKEVLEHLGHISEAPDYLLEDIKGKNMFHRSASRGHLTVLEHLVEKLGGNTVVNMSASYDKDGFTPFQYALNHRQVEVCKELVKLGSAMSIPFKNGSTPIHALLDQAAWVFIAELDPPPHDFDATDSEGSIAWHIALTKRYLPKRFLHWMLDKPVAIHRAGGPLQSPPLQYALRTRLSRGHLVLLLRYGAVPNHRDASNMNALHAAALLGDAEATKLMLKYAAKVDVAAQKNMEIYIGSAKDWPEQLEWGQGATILDFQAGGSSAMQGIQRGSQVKQIRGVQQDPTKMTVEQLEGALSAMTFPIALVIEGGTCNESGSFDEEEADALDTYIDPNLAAALRGRNLQYTKDDLRFAMKRAYLEIGAGNSRGQAAVHLAALSGDEVTLALLLNAGANPRAVDNEHKNLIHFAAIDGHTNILKFVLDKLTVVEGIGVNTKDDIGFAPLHYASREGKINAVKELLQRGATVDLKAGVGGRGVTPLHLAAAMGHAEVVEELLARGTLADSEDVDKLTPYDYALAGQDASTEGKYRRVMKSLLIHAGTETKDVDRVLNQVKKGSWLCMGCRSANMALWTQNLPLLACTVCGDDEEQSNEKVQVDQSQEQITYDSKEKRCRDSKGRLAKCPRVGL